MYPCLAVITGRTLIESYGVLIAVNSSDKKEWTFMHSDVGYEDEVKRSYHGYTRSIRPSPSRGFLGGLMCGSDGGGYDDLRPEATEMTFKIDPRILSPRGYKCSVTTFSVGDAQLFMRIMRSTNDGLLGHSRASLIHDVLKAAMEKDTPPEDLLMLYDYMYCVMADQVNDAVEHDTTYGEMSQSWQKMLTFAGKITLESQRILQVADHTHGPCRTLVHLSHHADHTISYAAAIVISRVSSKKYSFDGSLIDLIVGIPDTTPTTPTPRSLRYLFDELSMLATKHSDNILIERTIALSKALSEM